MARRIGRPAFAGMFSVYNRAVREIGPQAAVYHACSKADKFFERLLRR
jgi:hypothetical protein